MREKRERFLSCILWLFAATLLTGCSKMVLLSPKGPVGDEARFSIVVAFVLMLIVIIPVFIMAFWFPLVYRASDHKAVYLPKWSHSLNIDLVVWMIPIAIVTLLSVLTWKKTRDLDPYRPVDPAVAAVRVEVVSLDWKWLFIYPDYDVATVNELVFPVNVPLSFRLTSDTVMTSFFIPQLGSQIYAMGGMQTRLHLMADEPGVYTGQNQQFSGRGYCDMSFKAIAVSKSGFEAWIKKVRSASDRLDSDHYKELESPSMDVPVTYFSSVASGLFDDIIRRTMTGTMGRTAKSVPADNHAMEGR